MEPAIQRIVNRSRRGRLHLGMKYRSSPSTRPERARPMVVRVSSRAQLFQRHATQLHNFGSCGVGFRLSASK